MQAIRLLSIAVAMATGACSEQPQRKVSATVVDIAPRVSRWHADEVLVTARSESGLLGQKAVETIRLACRLGDRVQASARGVSLTLNDRACER